MDRDRHPDGVFVTGAMGCIGAWVVRAALQRGFSVTTFDQSTDRSRLEDVLDPDQLEHVRILQGDITSGAQVVEALEDSGASHVVHLAGLQVPFCKADPALGAMVNVIGTLNVFEAVAALGLRQVVYASSAAVYGPLVGEAPPDETSPCEPITHYGVFKRANEGNARIYWSDQGISSVGLRPLTVYGVGRDQGLTSGPTRAMKAAICNQPFQIAFTGSTDYQYVEDTAIAFLEAALRGPDGAHVFNLHGDSVSTDEILKMIHAACDDQEGMGLTDTGNPLPIPPRIDGRALDEAIPNLPHTKLSRGINETMQRFRELKAQGRLRTKDIETP